MRAQLVSQLSRNSNPLITGKEMDLRFAHVGDGLSKQKQCRSRWLGRHPTQFVRVASERLVGSRDSYEEDEILQYRRQATKVPFSVPSSLKLRPLNPDTVDSNASTLQHVVEREETSTETQAAVPAAALFDHEHVKSWNLAMLLYAPVGVLVACFRMACWVAGILIDAPWFRNKAVVTTYMKLLGFTTDWQNLQLLPKGHHVMVSNHTTSADLMVLFSMAQRYVHLITSAMPAKVTKTNNLPVILRHATPEVYDDLARQQAAAAAAGPAAQPLPPVHVFPEGGLTNGNGMLQFSRGFMKFVPPGTPVVPVALRAHTPWGIRTHTLCSSFLANLFWLSFCPWVRVEAIVLPAMTQQPGEGRGAFVQRVQSAIAKELNIPISDVTIQQKRQLMRKAARHK